MNSLKCTVQCWKKKEEKGENDIITSVVLMEAADVIAQPTKM